MKQGRGARLARMASAAAWVTLATGCGIVSSGDPETALVEVAGAAGATLNLVVSNQFTTRLSDDPDDGRRVIVDLESSDTISIDFPYQQRFDLGSRVRFFAQVFNQRGADPVEAAMRVLIDSDERYNSSRPVTDQEVLEFVYVLGN
jgi:hypothetical protein